MIPIRIYNIDRDEIFKGTKYILHEEGYSLWQDLHYFEPKIIGEIAYISKQIKAYSQEKHS